MSHPNFRTYSRIATNPSKKAIAAGLRMQRAMHEREQGPAAFDLLRRIHDATEAGDADLIEALHLESAELLAVTGGGL